MSLMQLVILAFMLCGQAHGVIKPKGIALKHSHFGNFLEPFKIRFYYLQGNEVIQRICSARSDAFEVKNMEECRIITKVDAKEFQNYLEQNNYFFKENIQNEQAIEFKTKWAYFLKTDYNITPDRSAFNRSLHALTDNIADKLHLFFWNKSLELKEQNKLTGFFRTLRASVFEGRHRQLVVTGDEKNRVHWAKVTFSSIKQNNGSKILLNTLDDPKDFFTCSAIFGEGWREVSYDEVERNYDKLYETEFRYHLENETFWLSDTSVSNGKESKAVFTFSAHKWLQRLSKKMEMTELPNAAHRLCICDEDQCI